MGRTVKLRAGGRAVPVRVTEKPKTLRLAFDYWGPLTEEVRCMVRARFLHKTKEWEVSRCPRNDLQLLLLQGEIPSEIARYDTPISDAPPSRHCLFAHQRDLFSFARQRRRCVVAAEMGTGKTLAVIELMDAVGGDWIYCAPKKVLPAIDKELSKWSAKTRPRLINYARLEKALVNWSGPAPAGVVFDESSRLKNPSARRTMAAQHLADEIRQRDGYVILLTGTPAPKNPTDWWSQAEIACPGFLRESSRVHLERRLANYESLTLGDGRVVPQIVNWKLDEVEHLRRRLEGLVYVLRAADCQDLPPIRYELVPLEPSKATQRAARMLADGSVTQVLNALRQLSDGFQYTDEGVIRAPCPKDRALRELLAVHEEVGRIIIYAGYHASVDRCAEICAEEGWETLICDGRGWRGFDRDSGLSAMDRSTDTGTPERLAFVAHPGSGGMGLTLTASPSAVYYSNDFNAESRIQSEKRGHREGMGGSFTIYDLIHLPTDQLVLDNLKAKRRLQDLTLGDIHESLS